MSHITIEDLRPVGSALFSDSETFLELLTEAGLDDIKGGQANVNSCLQLLATSDTSAGAGLKSLGATFLSYNAPFAKDSPFSVLNVDKSSLILSKNSEDYQAILSQKN